MKRLIFTILIAVATVSMLRAQEPTSLEAIPSSRLQDSLYAVSYTHLTLPTNSLV